MSVYPSHKNAVTILRGFRDKLTSNTQITNFDNDSKARVISEALQEELLGLREDTISIFVANDPLVSRQGALDTLGERWGLPRRRSTFADADAMELTIRFAVSGGGNFGSINGAADIIITAGTIISSNPDSNELGSTINYAVTTSTTLAAAATEGYVSVLAQTQGSESNVGILVLVNHNFTNYVDAANNSLVVANIYPILNGRDDESDRVYRYRLSRHYERMQQNNRSYVQLNSLEVPGVTDVRVLSGYFGIGTAGALVLGAEFQSNSRMVQGVQARLQKNKAPGLGVIATAGTQVTFDFELEITPLRTLTTGEQQNLTNRLRRSANDYLIGVSSAAVVDTTELAYLMQDDAGGVFSLGNRTSATSLFKRVYIMRGLAGATASERERLLGNTLVLEPDEFATLGTMTVTYL